jgi:hypothetical protein
VPVYDSTIFINILGGNTPHIKGWILIVIVGTLLRVHPSLRSREGMGVSSSCKVYIRDCRSCADRLASKGEPAPFLAWGNFFM